MSFPPGEKDMPNRFFACVEFFCAARNLVLCSTTNTQPKSCASAIATICLTGIRSAALPQSGDLCCISYFRRGPSTAVLRRNGNASWFPTKASHMLAHQVFITPLAAGVTPFAANSLATTLSCYHAMCSLAEVY